jgi:hypothetical protein
MSEEVRFKSVVGPELAGSIDLPDGEIRGWGIFVHGFTLRSAALGNRLMSAPIRTSPW